MKLNSRKRARRTIYNILKETCPGKIFFSISWLILFFSTSIHDVSEILKERGVSVHPNPIIMGIWQCNLSNLEEAKEAYTFILEIG